MLINWVQDGPPQSLKCILVVCSTAACLWPIVSGFVLRRKWQKQGGRRDTQKGKQARAEMKSKGNFSSLSKPCPASQYDTVLVNSPSHLPHPKTRQELASTSEISLCSCECSGLPTSQLWPSYWCLHQKDMSNGGILRPSCRNGILHPGLWAEMRCWPGS